MRIAAISLLALPALVAAQANDGKAPSVIQERAPALTIPFLSLTLGEDDPPKPTSSISSVVPTTPPTSSVPTSTSISSAPPPPSTTQPPTSATPTSEPPPTSSEAPPSSAPPSSTEPPSSSPATSETPSVEPSSEPPETTSEPPPSSSSTSSQQPTVIYKTVTEANGETTVQTTLPGNTDQGTKSSSIGTGAIVGIAVGAAAVLAILGALLFWLMRRARRDEDEAIRWPELNRHGDTPNNPALPVREHGSNERRMSLGSDFDDTPTYLTDDSTGGPAVSNYHGSNAHYSDEYHDPNGNQLYADQNYDYDAAPVAGNFRQPSPYSEREDYTNMPPPVQPQHSPVHGVGYEWDAHSESYGHDQYPAMQRHSPPMMGVGAGGVTFPQPQASASGHY